MNRSIIKCSLLLVLLVMSAHVLIAQNFTVTGTVVNAETGLAVQFANIGVEGTYLGTASDMDGNFEIKLSEALKERQITISAVGYKAKNYQVSEWFQKDGLMVQLSPVNYGLSEVSVAAQSKVGYGIVRAASNLIVDNYLTDPYSYRCYLRTITANEGRQLQDEATFLLADAKGYGERSFAEAYQDIHYRIEQSKPHHTISLLKDGLTFIDDLISQDIVRCPGNILSVESINDFEVNVEGVDVLNGDSVWVISYLCENPTIQTTGDPEIIKYSGKIWIAHQNNRVLKNSIEATRVGRSLHGKSFYSSPEQKDRLSYRVETNYKLRGNKMALNSIQYVEEETGGKKTSVYFKVVEVGAFTDDIKGRQYFNGVSSDDEFWNNYKRPQ